LGCARRRGNFLFVNSRFALQVAHFIFERKAEVIGHLPEFSRRLPKHARQFRQLLRAKYHQGDEEQHD
jgi:hypothetical protein